MKTAMVPHERQSPVSRPMKNRMRSTIMLLGILLHAILTRAFAPEPLLRPRAKNSTSANSSAHAREKPLTRQKSIAARKSAKQTTISMLPYPFFPGICSVMRQHRRSRSSSVAAPMRSFAPQSSQMRSTAAGRTCIR